MSWMDKHGFAIGGRGLRCDVGRPGCVPDEWRQETLGCCDLDDLELDFGQPWPATRMTIHNLDRSTRRAKRHDTR